MKFKDFIYVQDFCDLEQLTEAIDDHQPLNGGWNQPLTPGINYATYKFDVPGDNCGPGCYSVNISGDPTDGINISFTRRGTYQDQYKGFGPIVFKGVLKALSEYITTLKPKSLSWTSLEKTVSHPETGKIVNPNARAHVYEGWSLRNLFPDKYIGIEGKWIRRDIYDSQYVPQGFPPVPEEITKDSPSGIKKEALEKMRQEYQKNYIRIKEKKLRQEEERQRQRQERIQARVVDPELNPEGIRDGDIVSLKNIEGELNTLAAYDKHPAKVDTLLSGYDGDDEEGEVYARVKFATLDDPTENSTEFNGPKFVIKVSNLKKVTPEFLANREREKQEFITNLISSQETNPNSVQEGDEIITYIPNSSADNEQNGLRGKITKFKPKKHGLFAYVDWDTHAQTILSGNINSAVNVTFLYKATSEEIQKIARRRREAEIEQQIQKNRELQQQRIQRNQKNQSNDQSQDLESLINHPANPQHLKPGDYVTVVTGYKNLGRGGIIVALEKPSWSGDYVTAYVRFHGSRAAHATRFWSLADLQKDESEQARALQSRRQQQQNRLQHITAATNGFQIGDTVSIANGIHRGKTGRIVGFRASGQNVSANIATHDGNFNVNTRAITAASGQPVAAESLGFFRYFLNKYYEIV